MIPQHELTRRSPMTRPPKQSSLNDILGSGMNEKLKLKQIMDKHMGYERPKAPGKKIFSSKETIDL